MPEMKQSVVTYLLVELYESGFELLGNVLALVVIWEFFLTKALASMVFLTDELCLDGSG